MFRKRATRRPTNHKLTLETRMGPRVVILRNVSVTGMLIHEDGVLNPDDMVSSDQPSVSSFAKPS